jgi:hypothetical protein
MVLVSRKGPDIALYLQAFYAHTHWDILSKPLLAIEMSARHMDRYRSR